MTRKRNVFIKFMCFVMAMIIVFTGTNLTMTVQAATGLNLSGKTIRGYAYSNSNFSVYNSTASNKKVIGTCYGSSDLITIRGVGKDGWCYISYLAGKTTKKGYCKTSYLFQNPNFSSATGKVQSNITTYKKSDCKSTYGTSTTGDAVFIVGKNNGNTQILYPCSGYYKTAWVKGNYTISNGRFSKSGSNKSNNFLGHLDSVTSSANGQIEVKGWVFNWNELYKREPISVCVGGTFYSGAPKYTITANAYRPDVNKIYSCVGNYHGFSSSIKVSKTGNQTVYVYAGNGTKLLGSKNVNIKAKTNNNNSSTGIRITQGKYVFTTALNTSKCLDVHKNSSYNGANIQIFAASANNAAQIFSIESMGGEWYKIVHVSSKKVLDVCGGVAKSGVNVQLYQYNGSAAQQWRFLSTGNGMYYIENRLGYKLDVCGGVSTNGTNVWVYKTNYSNSQRWKLTPVKGNSNSAKAQKIVNYAKTQVGTSDKKGNNNVKYNTWYYGRKVSGNGYAWCQVFVSYCANQTGILNTAIPKKASCQSAVDWYRNKGRFYKSKYYGGTYTPKAGDLVFYTSNHGSRSNHVGIIIAPPVNGYLQVVEGNVRCNDGNYKVVKFTKNAKRTVGNSYVMGYGVPDYC